MTLNCNKTDLHSETHYLGFQFEDDSKRGFHGIRDCIVEISRRSL